MNIHQLAKLAAQKSAGDCHCYPGGPADPDKKGCKDPDCDHCNEKEAGLFYRDLDEPRSIKSYGSEVKNIDKAVNDFFDESNSTGDSEVLGLDVARLREPRFLTRLFNPYSDAETAYASLVEQMNERANEKGSPYTNPYNRALIAGQVLKDMSSTFGEIPEDFKPAKGDIFDLYKYDKKRERHTGIGGGDIVRADAVINTYDDDKKPTKKKTTKESFDVSSMANRAIQSPLGQGALNAGAGLYNKLPSQMRNRMGAYAMQAGGLNNQNVTNWKMPGFTPDPSQGTGIKSKTVAKTRQQGNQINESLNEKLRSMRPGHAGSPMGQLARGVMAGQMPSRTFPQGTPVANKVVVKNDQLKQDKIVPQAAYNRFTSGMGKGGSDIQTLAKAAASAAWQRKAGKNSKGGLNEKGRKSYERENPGSDLKAPVTGKVKPGGKAAKRRKSFCARMKGNKGPMKKPNGEPTRKALSLRKWKC